MTSDFWIAWAVAVGGFLISTGGLLFRGKRLRRDKAQHDALLAELHKTNPAAKGIETYDTKGENGWMRSEIVMAVGAIAALIGLGCTLVVEVV